MFLRQLNGEGSRGTQYLSCLHRCLQIPLRTSHSQSSVGPVHQVEMARNYSPLDQGLVNVLFFHTQILGCNLQNGTFTKPCRLEPARSLTSSLETHLHQQNPPGLLPNIQNPPRMGLISDSKLRKQETRPRKSGADGF